MPSCGSLNTGKFTRLHERGDDQFFQSLLLREEQRSRAFEKNVLMRIFKPKGDKGRVEKST
jgi:hypothetical protein